MKKGYTLIELMVGLMIFSIISLSLFILIRTTINVMETRNINRYETEFISLLYYGQKYCKNKGISGYVEIDKDKYSVRFESDDKTVSKITFPKKLEVQWRPLKRDWLSMHLEQKIVINNLGFINNEGDLELAYGRNKKNKVGIRAGGIYFEK